MTRYEIRPLGVWTQPRTTVRPSCRFRAPWTATLDLLERETDMLGARLVVLQVDVTDAEIRRDGMLRANTRIVFPGVKVSFDSMHGSMTYATDRYDEWKDNVRAIALSLEALRAVNRYGVTGSGEQYRGFVAIEAKAAGVPLDLAEAKALIDSYGDVKAALLATHPDRGGNVDDFHRVQEARRVLGI